MTQPDPYSPAYWHMTEREATEYARFTRTVARYRLIRRIGALATLIAFGVALAIRIAERFTR